MIHLSSIDVLFLAGIFTICTVLAFLSNPLTSWLGGTKPKNQHHD